MHERKEIKGHVGKYSACSCGRIYSHRLKGGSYLKGIIANQYFQVMLYRNNIGKQHKVHKLIIESFKGDRPQGKVVNHIDGNKLNNEPHNLEYIDEQGNRDHARRLDLTKKKLDIYDRAKIRELWLNGHSINKIAKYFNVRYSIIWNLICGNTFTMDER